MIVKPFDGLEKSVQRRNEYVKRGDDVLDRNVVRSRSSWNSDEIGESDI